MGNLQGKWWATCGGQFAKRWETCGGQLARETVGILWWATCKAVGNLWWATCGGKWGRWATFNLQLMVGNGDGGQLATCGGKLGKVSNLWWEMMGNSWWEIGQLGWEMPEEENGSEWSLFLASNGHSENKLSNEITETNKEYFIFSRMISFQRLPVRRRRVEPKKSEEQELPVPVANFTSSDLLTIFRCASKLSKVVKLSILEI